jgi:hypothetical protein
LVAVSCIIIGGRAGRGNNMGMTTITMMRKRARERKRNGQIKSKVVHVFLNIPQRSSFTILLTTVLLLKIIL